MTAVNDNLKKNHTRTHRKMEIIKSRKQKSGEQQLYENFRRQTKFIAFEIT